MELKSLPDMVKFVLPSKVIIVDYCEFVSDMICGRITEVNDERNLAEPKVRFR
jgi:hypothetical protein